MIRPTLLLIATCSAFWVWAQKPTVKRGSIDYIPSFTSAYVDARSVAIWKPENYNPTIQYNVLYMHDGQNVFDANITWNHQSWEAADHLQNLIDQGKISPCIVVAIWNNGSKRHAEYFPQKPFESLSNSYKDSLLVAIRKDSDSPLFKTNPYADDYLKFLVDELKPFIDKNYSTNAAQRGTYIAGASMGGLISWYAITEYPLVFGGAACFSTHWPGIWPEDDPKKKIFSSFKSYFLSHLPPNNRLYFDHGSETLDGFYHPYQNEIDLQIGTRFPSASYMSFYYPGFDHSEKSWSHHFEKAMLFLMNQ